MYIARRMRWTEHVEGTVKTYTKSWPENLKGRDQLKYLDKAGKKMLKYVLKELGGFV
jgi:hypothetical protein